MHTRLLCLWVLGIVSATDDQSQRPIYIISQNGSPPGYSNGQPFYGSPVSSNSVRVLPNAYGKSQSFEPSDGNASSISVPVIVDSNTPFQGNVNQPIPVPVTYSADVSAPTEEPQPAYRASSISVQSKPNPNVTPIPVYVKAPESAYRSVTSTPSPFEARKLSNEDNLENPYSRVSSSFRLWPKLPEPVPVPVLASDSFVRNSYRNINTNLVPQYLQKVPVPVKIPTSLLNRYQQDLLRPSYSQNTQTQTQAGQQANPGPIYIIVPRENNNVQLSSGGYQSSTQAQASYRSQSPQTGSQGLFILASPRSNYQSNQASYQNNGFSSNQGYFEKQQQDQSVRQSPLNYAIFGPLNAPAGQYQAQSSQQAPLNYAVFTPSNAPGSQSQAQSASQQAAIKYAIFGPINAGEIATTSSGQSSQTNALFAPVNTPGSSSYTAGQSPNYSVFAPINTLGSTTNSAGQSPQIYAVFTPTNTPGSTTNSAGQVPQNFAVFNPSNTGSQFQSGQSPLTFATIGILNGGSSYPSSTSSPALYTGYSTTQSSTPQYADYSSAQSPQYSGFSTTQSPSLRYNIGYSTQSQHEGYSSTPAPLALPTSSQSTPVSRVSFSGAGGSYNYSI